MIERRRAVGYSLPFAAMAESGVKKSKRRRQHSLIDKMKHVTPITRASAAIFSPRTPNTSTFSTVMPLITALQSLYVADDKGALLEKFEHDSPFRYNKKDNGREFTSLARNGAAIEHTKRVFGSQLRPLLALLPKDHMSPHQQQEFLHCLLLKATHGVQTTPRVEVSSFLNYTAPLFPSISSELTELCEARVNTLSHPLSVGREEALGEEILQPLWIDPTEALEWETVDPGADEKARPLVLIEQSSHFHYEGRATKLVIPSHAVPSTQSIPWTETLNDTKDSYNFISSNSFDVIIVSMCRAPHQSGKQVLVVAARDSFQLCAPENWKIQEILMAVSDLLQPQTPYQWIRYRDPEIASTLAKFERAQPIRNFQFGLLYCKQGQTDINYMYSNRNKISLKGWKGFAGNLDVKDNRNGTESIHTTHQGMEIMFHVSTMLPPCEGDKQQLDKKRFLSNDMTLIIYKEGSQKLDLTEFHSAFNHTFVIIQRVSSEEEIDGQPTFRVEIAYKRDVLSPPAPLLPQQNLFHLNDEFRTFLLSKLIHSERKAVRGKNFSEAQERVRGYLLRHIRDSFDKAHEPN